MCLLPFLKANYCLVLWPEENSVSVVSLDRVVEGRKAGDGCTVRINKILHEGKILATGKPGTSLLVLKNPLVQYIHIYAYVVICGPHVWCM